MSCKRRNRSTENEFLKKPIVKNVLWSLSEIKKNPEHHLTKENSPLLDIINFDPVKFVVLDEMHMLYLGITKYLIQKLILKSSNSFILQSL